MTGRLSVGDGVGRPCPGSARRRHRGRPAVTQSSPARHQANTLASL